ncbi:MAG: hypothetical protein QM754_08330 [Tepidisphaeraceae bacterium]
MQHAMNPMAQAWLDAGQDLGIRVQHPHAFIAPDGMQAMTVGVFLPDFGSAEGTLILCRFDADDVDAVAEKMACFQSSLSPQNYEPYRRSVFIETLNDWGWFGKGEPPEWFTGGVGQHGGSL